MNCSKSRGVVGFVLGGLYRISDAKWGICVATRREGTSGLLFNPIWNWGHSGSGRELGDTGGPVSGFAGAHYWFSPSEVVCLAATEFIPPQPKTLEVGDHVTHPVDSVTGPTVIVYVRESDGWFLLFSPNWDRGHSGNTGNPIPGFPKAHWWVSPDMVHVVSDKEGKI